MRSRDRCKGDYMKEPIHSVLHDVAIGIDATGMRREIDSMGEIEVPADRYWGAQTQRSLVHLAIGEDRMPKRVHHAYGCVKKRSGTGQCRGRKITAMESAGDHARR